ncbi:hypothetical protein ANDO1_0734 [plant metagenome]|uniref:Uncharacterized protein n=1 Tax=plant metagenome TaxID=1297885 RepID=A0A484Q5E9_9ZZZZ
MAALYALEVVEHGVIDILADGSASSATCGATDQRAHERACQTAEE